MDEQRVSDVDLLLKIGERIGSTLELGAVLEVVLDAGREITGCDRADIRLLDAESGELVLVQRQGAMTEFEPERVSAADGISARALVEMRTQWVPDVQLDDDYRNLLLKYPENTDYGKFLRSFRATVKVPILGPDRAIGVFCGHSSTVNDFSTCNFRLLEGVMRWAGWAVNSAKARDTLEYKLSVRREIERTAATSSDLKPVLDAVLQSALTRLNSNQGLIWLLDRPRGQLVLAACRGIGSETTPLTMPMGAGIAGQVADQVQPTLENDTRRHEGFKERLETYKDRPHGRFIENIRSMVAAPICTGGEAVGVIAACKGCTGGFRTEDLAALSEIAGLAAVPIRDGMLNETNRLLRAMEKAFRKPLNFLDEEGVLDEVLDYAMGLTGCAVGHVSLLDQTGQWLLTRNRRGTQEVALVAQQAASVGMSARALREGLSQMVANPHEEPAFQTFLATLAPHERDSFAELHTLAVVPLCIQKEQYGVLCLHSLAPIVNPAVICPLLDDLGGLAASLLRQCRLQKGKEAAERRSKDVERERDEAMGFSDLVGEGSAMRKLQEEICRVAPTTATVLLTGETGTGKELAARAIHARSGRTGRFVTVECPGLGPELARSELFGHLKGAFTGAIETKKGLVEIADGGTLFLDEINSLSLDVQGKLLRAIEEKAFLPVGGSQLVKADVRIVAAANKDLRMLVQNGSFREDFFYRISIVMINLPTLHERREDIPSLADHFLRQYRREHGEKTLHRDAVEALCEYDWPGNVRQLRNVIQVAMIFAPEGVILASNVVEAIRKSDSGLRLSDKVADIPGPATGASLPETISSVRKTAIEAALERSRGNVAAAARELEVDVATVKRWRKELRIDVNKYRLKRF
jgi:transcriptional regulator with GAF, ATPase, and Fis domain